MFNCLQKLFVLQLLLFR